ncbi:hypothetical protein SMD44_p20070 (plasmid) [Streptomyces alboflavus]|uniref:Uncharacterized protein n=1 Tax=Streptomyces alboflavus TaxID=67267 RepID=A0A291W4L6_9ACTN|nr:hypothetical protein [Streptomyces alboflavus]ATM24853.1 hypothetical protein SMD44_p20070 [Streptomyces alboflavus]
MPRKPKMDQEERRAYAAQMRAELEAVMDRAYGAMVVSQDFWAEVMRTGAVLADRSPVNVVAIAAQRPGTTRVLSAGDWRKAGRHPAKGSTSLRIWTPIKRRHAVEAPEGSTDTQQAPAEGASRKVSGYKAGPVFDLSQTEGDAYEHPSPPVAIRASAVRDVLITQYRQTYGDDPETAGGFDFTKEAPDHAARILLYGHAWRRIAEADAPMPGQHAAEVASAAHVAALMLGILPGPAAVPPLAGVVTSDKKPPIHGAVVRVIETGRAIADAVVSELAESGARELVRSS